PGARYDLRRRYVERVGDNGHAGAVGNLDLDGDRNRADSAQSINDQAIVAGRVQVRAVGIEAPNVAGHIELFHDGDIRGIAGIDDGELRRVAGVAQAGEGELAAAQRDQVIAAATGGARDHNRRNELHVGRIADVDSG